MGKVQTVLSTYQVWKYLADIFKPHRYLEVYYFVLCMYPPYIGEHRLGISSKGCVYLACCMIPGTRYVLRYLSSSRIRLYDEVMTVFFRLSRDGHLFHIVSEIRSLSRRASCPRETKARRYVRVARFKRNNTSMTSRCSVCCTVSGVRYEPIGIAA